MNTTHLQYIVEIERTRSISQAAENLYVGQPNLSRILHDMEDRVGFAIFERTSRGVHPTRRGALFLRHAHNILRETNQITDLSKGQATANRLRICLPRSRRYFDMVTDYLASLSPDSALHANIRECPAQQALTMLSNADAEIGIIRYRKEYEDYFSELAADNNLRFIPLREFLYSLVVARTHPLAGRERITQAELEPYTEITHGTTLRGQNEPEQLRTIHTVDRLAQMTLLKRIHGSYIWIGKQPDEILRERGLCNLECTDNTEYYHDTLVYPKSSSFSSTEEALLKYIKKQHNLTDDSRKL